MTLQKYVKQVRPRTEDYILPVDKIQNLFEATLSKADVAKRDNKNVLQDIINNQTPLETEKGEVSISWIDNANKIAFENDDFDTAFPKGKEVFITSNGDKIRITQITKTDIFGGGKGSGGGSSGTKAGESAQCVYLQAIWNNPSTDLEARCSAAALSFIIRVCGTYRFLSIKTKSPNLTPILSVFSKDLISTANS